MVMPFYGGPSTSLRLLKACSPPKARVSEHPRAGELPTARKVHRSFASLRMTGWLNFAHVLSRKARDSEHPLEGTAHPRKVHRSFASLRMTGWSRCIAAARGQGGAHASLRLGDWVEQCRLLLIGGFIHVFLSKSSSAHEKSRTASAVLPLYDAASSFSLKAKTALSGPAPSAEI
jgi:hypothetical protein